MSDSSDSEDDQDMNKFLEATDASLLTNDMYGSGQKDTESADAKEENAKPPSQPAPVQAKSQRHLPQDESNDFNGDLNLPASVQEHIGKKLSALIEKRVEFEAAPQNAPPKTKKWKSKVKLLQDSDCYVKTYEEFEYDTKGPEKKPEIKRRRIEGDDECPEDLSQIAVSGDAILAGEDCKLWAAKPEKAHKVFHYKGDSKGKLTAKEPTNEFTQRRRKNKWNESKIKEPIKRSPKPVYYFRFILTAAVVALLGRRYSRAIGR